MKNVLRLVFLLACGALSLRAQTTTTFTITVVAPPSCTVTIAPNPNSTSGLKLYSGQAGTLNFNVSACPAFSLPTAITTWDGTPLVLSGSLSAAVTATEATVGTHSVVLTIPQPVLSMTSPVTLPNGAVGVAYSVNLATLSGLTGGVPPYVFSLDPATPLPSGLSLSSSGLVTGTPFGAGSNSFNFTVTDSSQLSLLIRPHKSTSA